MAKTATTQSEELSIKRDRLIGIEQRPQMYALAASNMILRGDGKANLYQGSCFDNAIVKAVKEHRDSSNNPLRPNIGLINPPYAKSKSDLSELRFVENMLDMLEKKVGWVLRLCPYPAQPRTLLKKANIMSKHTLEAVMSMPPEVFYPVGVVTCIMVFTAGVPHAVANKKIMVRLLARR
ncbi:hypothetical protein GCM10020295_25790 [Streptomyces cinereospinus]